MCAPGATFTLAAKARRSPSIVPVTVTFSTQTRTESPMFPPRSAVWPKKSKSPATFPVTVTDRAIAKRSPLCVPAIVMLSAKRYRSPSWVSPSRMFNDLPCPSPEREA